MDRIKIHDPLAFCIMIFLPKKSLNASFEDRLIVSRHSFWDLSNGYHVRIIGFFSFISFFGCKYIILKNLLSNLGKGAGLGHFPWYS